MQLSLGVGALNEPEDVGTGIKILFVMTLLTLAPSILLLMTCFTRLVIVLSFVRKAMSLQGTPANQIIIGLALFMTFFIMAPAVSTSYNEGIKPYLDKQISGEEAFDKAAAPFRKFMLAQTREKDLALFVGIAGIEQPESAKDVPLHVLVPGFVISELRTAFQIAFVIFVPFLVIDMVVASILMSMGMMMLPPIIVSLPFKILLFVLVDGWYLLVKSLVESFAV
ncbi:MAG: flagellar type III secretion system pore protein FliP [Candidatus Zixiibacteriota bacterium]